MGKYVEVQISNLIEENRKEIIEAFLRAKTKVKETVKVQEREVQTVQKTLGGYSVSVIPKVRTTDGHLMEWDRNAIVSQLMKETKLGEQFLQKPAITEDEARDIAKEAEKRIKEMGVKFLSGPLVRELVNIILLERGHTEWRNISTRVGTPVFDAYRIDMGTGFEANDNANLQENAETSHKKKADKMSKEQYLLMLPPKLADAHLNGDIHIHDLEYLGTRAFCQDWDLRYFFYYGLMPDGSGTKASVAGPAKKAEVAILHAVKALGSAQTNFAGGQGFYNFLGFMAPYFEGMSYDEIEQLMQMFVYEMTQMMVARGGQLVFSSVQLSPGVPKLWRDKPVVYKGRVWDGVQAKLRTYGEFEREVRLGFEALMNVMLKGDYWGKPFNFPKPEISIEPDFMEEDEEFNRVHPEILSYDELYTKAFELAAKYGAPYFDNQLPEYRGAGDGISCYQCLAGDELVPIADKDGKMHVMSIERLFSNASKNGTSVDPLGVEFAEFDGRTPGTDFETFRASMETFKGVMRKKFRGKLLNIILNTGRRIRVTPDHPVFVLEKGTFVKKQAKELEAGEYMPVLKNTISEKLEKFNNGDVHPLKIKKIEEEEYDGYVYDLVDVSNAHNFSNALGVITGNCCAYNFSSSHDKDTEFEQKLYFKDGKHFSMGAWQVVSINCPRAAYRANKSDETLFTELKLLMDRCIELFKVKRKWMDIIIKGNRMPFATQRPKDPITMQRGEIAVDLHSLVYTIGVVGINEMIQHHIGKQVYESEDARRLAIRAMFELKFYAKELSEKHGMEIALARTPAETTAQRFAVSDLLHTEYKKCAEPIIKGNVPEALRRIHQTRDLPIYYTNGTHVPPNADVSLPQRIKLEETFFPIVDGGNILHIWMGEAAPDPQGLKEFAMNIAKNTQVGYFAFTKDMTVCMDDFHVASGMLKECPNCESENVEHLSRVTGYIQAVSGWNEAKKQELKDRKRYGVGGM
jgi:anaerobic ribonucleoside-triphosphate reductase